MKNVDGFSCILLEELTNTQTINSNIITSGRSSVLSEIRFVSANADNTFNGGMAQAGCIPSLHFVV
jgi:hypothetical protein